MNDPLRFYLATDVSVQNIRAVFKVHVDLYWVTAVSEQNIGPIFNDSIVCGGLTTFRDNICFQYTRVFRFAVGHIRFGKT